MVFSSLYYQYYLAVPYFEAQKEAARFIRQDEIE